MPHLWFIKSRKERRERGKCYFANEEKEWRVGKVLLCCKFDKAITVLNSCQPDTGKRGRGSMESEGKEKRERWARICISTTGSPLEHYCAKKGWIFANLFPSFFLKKDARLHLLLTSPHFLFLLPLHLSFLSQRVSSLFLSLWDTVQSQERRSLKPKRKKWKGNRHPSFWEMYLPGGRECVCVWWKRRKR